MRRALVMTDETAGHPFLASLPPHIRSEIKPLAEPRSGITAQDVIDFLLAYCACFCATLTFIS